MWHHEPVTDWIPPELLAPAFKAVRKALRDLDPDEVPAVLRRIVGQSARRLPPPLARKLAETLDENEWLREKAAEAGSDLDPSSPDPARAVSALFLLRPDGWEDRAREAAEHRASGAQQALVATLQRTIADLQQQLEVAREKAKGAQQRAQAAAVAADRKAQSARSAIEAARQEERLASDELRRDHGALHERYQRLVQDLEEAGERITALRDDLLRTRRTSRSSATPAGPQAWAPRDPLEIARMLDDIVEAVRPEAVAVSPEVLDGVVLPFALPAGVSPDQKDAVAWLATYEEAYGLVVDGYNVTFLLDEETFTDPSARDRLNEGLARFRRMASAPVQVVVVYDSAQSGGMTANAGPGGIEIRFTESGHTADEEILAMAAAGRTRLAVVSTDRRVREGAEEYGALGLWSQALVAWLERR
jgi:predicted RNA-binding protein with PIN domain